MMIKSIMLSLWVSTSWAGDCEETTKASELDQIMDVGLRSWEGGDLVNFNAAIQQATWILHCLDEPIRNEEARRYHLIQALAQAQSQVPVAVVVPYLAAWKPMEDEERELRALIGALEWSGAFGGDENTQSIADLEQQIESLQTDVARRFPPPTRGQIRVDGEFSGRAPGNTPYIFQRVTRRGKVLPETTQYVLPHVKVPRYPRLRNALFAVTATSAVLSTGSLLGAQLTATEFENSGCRSLSGTSSEGNACPLRALNNGLFVSGVTFGSVSTVSLVILGTTYF